MSSKSSWSTITKKNERDVFYFYENNQIVPSAVAGDGGISTLKGASRGCGWAQA